MAGTDTETLALTKGELAVITASLLTGNLLPIQHQDRDSALAKVKAARTAAYGDTL